MSKTTQGEQQKKKGSQKRKTRQKKSFDHWNVGQEKERVGPPAPRKRQTLESRRGLGGKLPYTPAEKNSSKEEKIASFT